MPSPAVAWIAAAALLAGAPFAQAQKLTEEDRVELLRGLMAEYATVKALLPRSPKPLPFEASGNYDKQLWQEAGQKYGPAARLGDLVQITHLDIEDNRLVFEINGGMKAHGRLRDHIQVGMSGPMSGGVSQVNTQQTSAPSGTVIALLFGGPIPPVKADEVKKMLAPILNFNVESATENYVDTLPQPIQDAIKAHKVIVGMNRDQVLLAMGKPRLKERNVTADGTETEDWIYGEAPGKITFVTFANSKVTQVKEAYADLGGSTASPIPIR